MDWEMRHWFNDVLAAGGPAVPAMNPASSKHPVALPPCTMAACKYDIRYLSEETALLLGAAARPVGFGRGRPSRAAYTPGSAANGRSRLSPSPAAAATHCRPSPRRRPRRRRAHRHAALLVPSVGLPAAQGRQWWGSMHCSTCWRRIPHMRPTGGYAALNCAICERCSLVCCACSNTPTDSLQ